MRETREIVYCDKCGKVIPSNDLEILKKDLSVRTDYMEGAMNEHVHLTVRYSIYENGGRDIDKGDLCGDYTEWAINKVLKELKDCKNDARSAE